MAATAFELRTDRVGNATHVKAIHERFLRNRGPDHVAEFLNRAGFMNGLWTLKVFDCFKGAGRTPLIQIRSVDPRQNAITIWVKPGSNDSGTRCLLIVPTDLSLPQTFNILKEAIFRDSVETIKEPETVEHIDLNVDDDTTNLILTAVAEAYEQGGAWSDLNSFVADVSARMSSEDADSAYWLEAMDVLADRELLNYTKYAYELTEKGKKLLHPVAEVAKPVPPKTILVNHPSGPIAMPAPAEPEPVKAQVTPPAPEANGVHYDAIDVLSKVGDRLRAIQEIPAKVATANSAAKQARERVQSLKTQIGKLQSELAQEEYKLSNAEREAKELVGRLDDKMLNALAALIQ
jgi:hypothetical protein